MQYKIISIISISIASVAIVVLAITISIIIFFKKTEKVTIKEAGQAEQVVEIGTKEKVGVRVDFIDKEQGGGAIIYLPDGKIIIVNSQSSSKTGQMVNKNGVRKPKTLAFVALTNKKTDIQGFFDLVQVFEPENIIFSTDPPGPIDPKQQPKATDIAIIKLKAAIQEKCQKQGPEEQESPEYLDNQNCKYVTLGVGIFDIYRIGQVQISIVSFKEIGHKRGLKSQQNGLLVVDGGWAGPIGQTGLNTTKRWLLVPEISKTMLKTIEKSHLYGLNQGDVWLVP